MANAYSTPINYGQTIPTTDLAQYLGTIQHGMQQKFDVNLAKIDELISKVSSVPLKRDKDKRYLGEKLQNLLSVVDANSKIDLTDNVVARQISSQIASAIDDNVRTQMQNSAKLDNLDKELAEKKAKHPELYNEANHVYALDKAGYTAYINEETDELGTVQYNDYYDINTNFTKKLEDFAKERGFEKVLDSSVEGGYIYKTVKGKELTQEEVSNFFNTTLASDPKLKQQFMINAHYSSRGLSDEEIVKDYKEKAEPILKDFDDKIVDIEGKLKNVNPDDKATADLLHRQKSELQKGKEDFSSQLDIKNFNRNSFLYSQYANSLKNSYIKTYAYSATTDIKFDDFLLDIAKAKGEVSADGTPVGGDASGLPGGTLFQRDMVATDKEEQPDYMTDFNKQRAGSWSELSGTIKAQLIKDGKQPTNQNITNYYLGLKKASKEGIDLNAQGYNSELISAYGKAENLNKIAYQLTKVAKETYGKSTEGILNGLWGGKGKDLNIQGLATTMPITSELLKKYKSPEQMTKKEKAVALYEVAQNLKDHVLDEEDTKQMQFYIDSLKRENGLTDKDIKKVQVAKKGLEDSATWDVLSTYGKRIAEAPGNILSMFTTFRPEAVKKANEEYSKREEAYIKDLDRAWKHAADKIGNFFTSDTNLDEIQSEDIKLGKYQGVGGLMTDTKSSAKARFEQILSKTKANLQKESSIVLNPTNKRDKPYLDAINSAIVAQGGTPVQDGFLNIKSIKDGIATISYTSEEMIEAKGGGTKKQNIPGVEIQVPVNNLPQNLVKNLQTSLSDWSYSANNPTKMQVSMAYSPPNNLESRYELAQKYVQNNSAYMTQEEIKNLQMTGFSAIKTKEELQKEADKKLPMEYASDFSNKYLSSKYSVKWERPEGGGGFVGYLIKDGKKIEQIPPLATDYNPHTYGLYTMKVINQYLEDQITEYRRKALYSNN